MQGPYITTILEASTSVRPNQMNNRIYRNIKENLIKQYEGKCYKNYGFISKIYEIKEYSDGIVTPENPTASAYYNVKFTCKLCNPMKSKQIICKIEKINNMFTNAQNGPITVIIVADLYDKNNFVKDGKTGRIVSKKTNTELNIGTYVKVTILTKQFNDMDTIIMAMGQIDDVVTDSKEIKNSFQEEYGVDDNIVNVSEVTENKENN